MTTLWHACRTASAALVAGLAAVPASARPQDPPQHADKNGKPAADEKGKALFAVPVPDGPPLSLGECLAIALERNPNVRAANASLQGAQSGYAALMKLHPWNSILARDLPVRKQQAAQGLAVAQADVCKARQETVYDVTRLYYSFVYARQQEEIVRGLIVQLDESYLPLARSLLDVPPAADQRESERVTPFTVSTLRAGVSQANQLRIPAVTGQPLALAALKQAMGVDQSFTFVPKDTALPVMGGTVTREQVVAAAMAARAEVAQAAAGAEAFRLEVAAQDAQRFARRAPTLATGSDLHSRSVPPAVRNGEYRPGAVAPEMPGTLVGRRDDRVARAADLSARQDIASEGVRGLIELQAINAFHLWQASAEKLRRATERFEESKKVEQLTKDALAANSRRVELAVQNEVLVAKWRTEYLEAVFDHVKALANLELVTAGGVAAGFPGR